MRTATKCGVVALLLLAFAARAEAGRLSQDREFWFRTYDGVQPIKMALNAWGDGVSEVLAMVVTTHGCTNATPVSGRALVAATTDLLRQNPTWTPMTGTLITYGRLSGCSDALDRWLGVTPR